MTQKDEDDEWQVVTPSPEEMMMDAGPEPDPAAQERMAARLERRSLIRVARWVRLIQIWMIACTHAALGTFLVTLEHARDRYARKMEKRSLASRGVANPATGATSSAPPKPKVPRAKGKALSRSKLQKGKAYPFTPENCPEHPVLTHHANQYLMWMTCTKCGSRWQSEELTPTHSQNWNQTLPDLNKDQLDQLTQIYNMNTSNGLDQIQAMRQLFLNCGTAEETKAVMAFAHLILDV